MIYNDTSFRPQRVNLTDVWVLCDVSFASSSLTQNLYVWTHHLQVRSKVGRSDDHKIAVQRQIFSF